MNALSMPAQVVVLLGPTGAGATTVLRQWAADHAGAVVWGMAGALPEAAPDVLILDNADELSETDWAQITKLRRTAPELIIRGAAHTRGAVPAREEPEFVVALMFTLPETTQYLAEINSDLDAGIVQRLTGGLPTAVRALGRLNTNRAPLVNETIAALAARSLASEQRLLAVPEVLTQEIVRQLGGPPSFLDNAERQGLGEWSTEPGHPLFRLTATVRAATLQAHPVSAPEGLRARVGRTLLVEQAWFGALVEGSASGALDIVDAALKGAGMSILRDHGPMLKVLLRGIPLRELRRRPVIAFALALIFNARQQHRLRAIEMLGIALLGVRSTPDGSGERALAHAIASVARRLLGVGDGGVKAAELASRILAELSAEDRQKFSGLMGDLHSHSAISLMYGGRDSDAIVEFERALAHPGRPTVQLVSCGGIAMISALAGELETAQRWVDTALERPWAASILDEYPGSMLHIAQTKILLERGELDRADECLDRVWHIIGTVEHWPALAHLRAMIAMARGDSAQALEKLRALRHRRGSRSPRSQIRLLDLTESSLMLAAGDAGAAHSLRASAGDLPAVTIGVARVELFAGRPEHALRLLTRIADATPEVRAHRAVLEALALNSLGRSAEAEVAARRARTVAGAHGLSTPFLLVPVDARALFGAEIPAIPAGVTTPVIPRLTKREHVVLAELLETASTDEIAARLQVSANTVKSQRASIYRKLGAASREEALAIALGHGLLT